jgi:hypothetical protein
MVLLEGVDNAVSAAAVIAEKLPSELSKTAVRLYTALCAAAIETARAKGFSANVTHMTMHCPVEQVAKACRLSRQSVWRHLPALRELGVLDYRTHKANCRGLVRNSGTVFQVRLNPSSGSKCRLSFADLKFKWRDLDRDVRQGRTSYRALQHTEAQASKEKEIDISAITDWSLAVTKPNPVMSSVCSKGSRVSLESLFDVRFSRTEERAKAVDTAATALSQALADSRSVNFYRRIVWGALRASQAGTDYFQVIYNMVVRAQVDLQEGFARKAGALFCSRLKAAGLYDDLLRSS